ISGGKPKFAMKLHECRCWQGFGEHVGNLLRGKKRSVESGRDGGDREEDSGSIEHR
ncbi:hypothetical protein PIB30_064488, partial [Stylosanthes scabra]|nr:hypothetical protein [Stylosanthes scabra]